MLFVALCMTIALEAYGIEPSTQIVVRNGRKMYLHKVEKGHTLYAIAKAYGVTEKQIKDCNNGLTAETLRIDDVILVPCVDSKDKAKSQPKGKAEKGDGDAKFYTHVVKGGETLYSIARNYKISVDVILADNPSVEASNLSLGTELRIRRGEVGYASSEDINREESVQQIKPNEHVVQAGETVYSLSRKAGLTEHEFLALNKLSSAADLKLGMVVLMYNDSSVKVERTEPADDAMVVEEDVTQEEPAEVVEEPKQRQRLSGRDDDDPVVEEGFMADIFSLFGGERRDNNSFKFTNVDFLTLGQNNILKVALMLPFQIEGKVKPGYVDFYRGVLLALEDLKAEGLSIDMTVFDTQNDARVIDDIMTYEDAFLDAQLIIGPVFENELRYVVGHAERENIAVVSPLATVDALQSPVLFQMSPSRAHKYDKVKDLVSGGREVITIYSSTNDTSFLNEVHREMSGVKHRELIFAFDRVPIFYERTASGGKGARVDMESILRSRTSKTIIVGADKDTDIDRILTSLSSMKSKLLDRGSIIGDYRILGNYKWTRLENIDPQSFFKNNVSFVVSYHAKRDSEKMRLFDGRFISTYDAIPTAFAYRGYDAVMIFCKRMYAGLDNNLAGEVLTPLATSYRFQYEKGINVNCEWMCEQYNDNFTITTK